MSAGFPMNKVRSTPVRSGPRARDGFAPLTSRLSMVHSRRCWIDLFTSNCYLVTYSMQKGQVCFAGEQAPEAWWVRWGGVPKKVAVAHTICNALLGFYGSFSFERSEQSGTHENPIKLKRTRYGTGCLLSQNRIVST